MSLMRLLYLENTQEGKKMGTLRENIPNSSITECLCPHKTILVPSDVHKQVLCSLVDVEDFIPEQAQAGGALQSQLPQRQSCCIAVERRVAQDETDCRENREEQKWVQTETFWSAGARFTRSDHQARRRLYNTHKQSTSPSRPVTGIHRASEDTDTQLRLFVFSSWIICTKALTSASYGDTNGVRLSRVEHRGRSGDEGEQLGVPPLVSWQVPPGINTLKADQRVRQRLQGTRGSEKVEVSELLYVRLDHHASVCSVG